jgi:hypothetical protein
LKLLVLWDVVHEALTTLMHTIHAEEAAKIEADIDASHQAAYRAVFGPTQEC